MPAGEIWCELREQRHHGMARKFALRNTLTLFKSHLKFLHVTALFPSPTTVVHAVGMKCQINFQLQIKSFI